MDTAKVVEEQSPIGRVTPLGPERPDAERILWLEFQTVQNSQDIHTLTTTLLTLTTSVQGLSRRLALMTGILIGIMGLFKMLPDKSLDVLRHFLAG